MSLVLPAWLRRGAGCICLALAAAATAPAQQTPLLIGMTAPLSGPTSSYGRGLQHGIQLAIVRANEAGGVDGRKLELLALDDHGDASAAAANARELMRRGAFALTGVHGARAAAAVADVLAAAGSAAIPLVAPATGAEGLREPPRPAVFHLRAGTFDEMNAAMLHLDTVGMTRYALVSQEGVFGDSARYSLEMQLIRIGLRPVARHSVTGMAEARPALSEVCAAQPQVVVLALNEALALAAIEAGRAHGCNTQYLVFSETGASLAERAAERSAAPGSSRRGEVNSSISMPIPGPVARGCFLRRCNSGHRCRSGALPLGAERYSGRRTVSRTQGVHRSHQFPGWNPWAGVAADHPRRSGRAVYCGQGGPGVGRA